MLIQFIIYICIYISMLNIYRYIKNKSRMDKENVK